MPRALKIYTVQSHASFAPYAALRTVGAPSHVQQANMYVAAHNKADAARFLNEAGAQMISPRHIFEARGYCFEVLRDNTDVLGAENGIAVMWSRSSSGGKVAVKRDGNWAVIGEATYIDPSNTRRVLDHPIFLSAEDISAKPVRITIELDADMDPELVARLIAGTRCTIGFGRITAHEVVGRVVTP